MARGPASVSGSPQAEGAHSVRRGERPPFWLRFFEAHQRDQGRQRAVIVMYHGFTPGVWGALSPVALRKQLGYIAREYEVVAVAQLARRLRSGQDTTGLVALTFDDGYLDFATVAYPMLRELGLPASLYVPTAYIGLANEWEDGSVPRVPLLSAEMLQQFDPSLVTIGSHTTNHRALAHLDGEDLATELQGSRRRLEEIVGSAVREIAYPFGHRGTFNERTREAVAAAGYEIALSTYWSTWASAKDVLALPRIHLPEDADDSALRARLNGHSDLIGVRESLTAAIRAR